tara:strand:- start:1308 stop:1529 length:222 start_codon:yes stop_codon:yes gene_type:complete
MDAGIPQPAKERRAIPSAQVPLHRALAATVNPMTGPSPAGARSWIVYCGREASCVASLSPDISGGLLTPEKRS